MTARMGTARLGPEERTTALARMAAQELDVVVIGGGVVGAGVALDAATRGLSVGVVEARDFASGTSSRSSKLIHGGLRYLEQLNFDLVREALRERSLLLKRIAPHLVKPVPFLFPLTHQGWERPYIGAGLVLYDTLGLSFGLNRGVPGHRHLTRRQALRVAPSLRRSAFTGAVQYWDAQVDDARFVMTTLRTAATYGAHVASRVQAVGFLREGSGSPGCACATWRRARSSTCAPARSSTPPASGPTTSSSSSAAGGRSTCGRPRASTSWCRATASTRSAG